MSGVGTTSPSALIVTSLVDSDIGIPQVKKTRLLQLWESLRASYWFIPGAMTLGAIVLAGSAEALDRVVPREVIQTLSLAYQGGPEGARAVLTTVAGSMITVAGVTFSITMVALVLASSQFGPRILRNFMRDRGNQFVLGTFIATFLYCLLMLRTVQGIEDAQFVPSISVTIAIILALGSVAVLIYFIDHVADSIQAPNVVARVGSDLDRAVDRVFQDVEEDSEEGESGQTTQPVTASASGGALERVMDRATRVRPEKESDEPPAKDAASPNGENEAGITVDEIEKNGRPIMADRSGYIQLIDEGGLVNAAAQADVVLSCLQRQGGFAVEGTPLVRAAPAENVDEDLEKRVQSAFLYGNARTDIQDVDFALKQLVEIAVRALSPGINDPFTAINCVDRLTASLALAGGRAPLQSRLRDDEETTRVHLRRAVFPQLLDTAFDPIREHGRTITDVLARIVESVVTLEMLIERTEGRIALLRHADQVVETAEKGLTDRAGLRRVEALHRLARQRLDDVVEEEDEEEDKEDGNGAVSGS